MQEKKNGVCNYDFIKLDCKIKFKKKKLKINQILP